MDDFKNKKVRSRKGAPGIVDVAKRASVSPATVSRYFNDPDLVRGNTKKEIEKAAEELGYIRDRMAGTLNSGFSGTIGLIVPTIDNAIFSELIEAFSKTLGLLDRTMLIASHSYDLYQEVSIVRSLLERRIDGIVLVGFDHDPIVMNMLEQRDIPVISIWNHDEKAHLPSIGTDNFEAGQLIARHILDLQHRDILFVFADVLHNDRARGRMEGALSEMEAMGVIVDPSSILYCPYDIGQVKEQVLNFLRSHKPTAILCVNDVIAQGAVYACQTLGLRVPEDISVAGIGDFRGSAHMMPALTTVRLPAHRIGEHAAKTIVEMSKTGAIPHPKHKLFSGRLIKRESTGPAKGL